MKRVSRALFGLLVLFASPALWAKGDMVLIEVKAKALSAPIKITDTKIQEFSVWAGPGVNGSGLKEADGFIAEWKKGAVAEPPAELERYELSFYAGCRTAANCLGDRPSLVYVVSYAYAPLSNRGFIYLPGKGEASYSLNVRTIYHGPQVEGHWFFATDSWENFVRPLIAKARKST